MNTFENQNYIVIRYNDFLAVAYCAPYFDGNKGELEIQIYRRGFKTEADTVCVKGGKLSDLSRFNSLTLLNTLLGRAFDKWQDKVITFDCPDTRRARVYAKLLTKHGIKYNQSGSFFEVAGR